MRNFKLLSVLLLCMAVVFTSCGTWNNTAKGTAIGVGGGAAVGAGVGALAGNTALGSIIGAAVGGTAGALIGKKMDKQKKELEATLPEETTVETINNGEDNTGKVDYNQTLSEKRAKSVFDYLMEDQGVSSKRMTYEGKGVHEPVADNSTPEGRALNRRVEILILPNSKMVQEAQQGTLR